MSTARTPDRQRPVVVLAEDDGDIRELLAGLLAADGFEVETVCDGTELAVCLERRSRTDTAPAVIVTDHRMPGPCALDVLQRYAPCERPPVVVITAFGDEAGGPARQLGVKAVFAKPFDPDDFRTAVVHWSRCRRERP